MTNEQAKVIEKYLKRWQKGVVSFLDSQERPKPSTASGKSASEVVYTIEKSKNRATLFGPDWSTQLEFGRAAGKAPPVDAMKEWVKIRFSGLSETEQNSVAYLVGRKIAEDGTDQHQTNKPSGIFTEVITEQEIKKLTRELALVTLEQTTAFIVGGLKL